MPTTSSPTSPRPWIARTRSARPTRPEAATTATARPAPTPSIRGPHARAGRRARLARARLAARLAVGLLVVPLAAQAQPAGKVARVGLLATTPDPHVPVSSAAELDGAFAVMTRRRPDALFTGADPLTFRERSRIVEFAARSKLPGIYEWREFVELGGLMAYGVSLPGLFRQTGGYVDKILRGARPADLPVEQATKFELAVNLKTARALGLTIPQSVLLRADQVIE